MEGAGPLAPWVGEGASDLGFAAPRAQSLVHRAREDNPLGQSAEQIILKS